MLSNKKFWGAFLTLLLIAGGAGYFYYTTTNAAAKTAVEEQPLQTAPVRQGEIIISATGAGTVIPTTEIGLAFPSSGILAALNVQVGDQVITGDVLARLDNTSAQQAVANTELQLAQAIMKTDASATESGISYNAISIEQAEINLAQAQTNLDDLLNWEPDADEIARAEASLDAAKASYNAAIGQESSSYTNVSLKSISLEQAQDDLEDAQSAYNTAFDSGRDWELNDPRKATQLENERDAAERNLERAQDNLRIAELNYSAAASSSNSSGSMGAQSNLLNAELALQTALTGPTDEEIETAETTVRQAELGLQQALLNLEADNISLAQSRLNLEAAQQTLADMELIAPMDGTVMSVGGNVGELAGAGAFITLADLDQPMLEVYLDETDLDKVGVGYEVEVIFDALPDDTFVGHVVQVDPQLSTVSGVTAVRAVVELDSFAKPQNLPVGLNATVDVIGGRAENAMLVPVESLRELSPGQYALFVMEDGEPKLTFVEVGLMDYTYAEILSGVEVGDVVTTGIIETE